jgi:hypothetical protein
MTRREPGLDQRAMGADVGGSLGTAAAEYRNNFHPFPSRHLHPCALCVVRGM